MRTDDLTKPTVPASYARIVLDAAEVYGVRPRTVLRSAGVDPGTTDALDGRISVLDIGLLLDQAIRLTDEPGLGYEMALSSSVMSHGVVGFGMLTCPTLREAIELGLEFLQLRVPMLSAELRTEGDRALVTVSETVPLGSLRVALHDLFLVKLVRIGQSLTGHRIPVDEVEVWFDYPEPQHYARWADRLPPMAFDRGANALCFPARLLDLRPETADATNALFAADLCRQEADQLGISPDFLARVRATLRSADGYRSLSEVAEVLHVSVRTLKRRLHDHGTTFNAILETARRSEATRLLATTSLSVEEIARQVGYADARSFRRAFQAWTDSSPSAYRARLHG